MRKPKPSRLLVVSPHLDDAVLSVGANISALTREGTAVTVCTVFAGTPIGPVSPAAQGFHDDCGLTGDPIKPRQMEDNAALRLLGAEPVHLPYLDAVYRRCGDGWLCEEPRSMFRADPPFEPQLETAIVADIQGLIADHAPGVVWTCRGIGGHIDHRITRRAVLGASLRLRADVAVWEDLPYGFTETPRITEPISTFADVQPGDIEAKVAAIGAYASQTRMLWPDTPSWMDDFRINAQARRRTFGAAELLWTDLLSELAR